MQIDRVGRLTLPHSIGAPPGHSVRSVDVPRYVVERRARSTVVAGGGHHVGVHRQRHDLVDAERPEAERRASRPRSGVDAEDRSHDLLHDLPAAASSVRVDTRRSPARSRRRRPASSTSLPEQMPVVMTGIVMPSAARPRIVPMQPASEYSDTSRSGLSFVDLTHQALVAGVGLVVAALDGGVGDAGLVERGGERRLRRRWRRGCRR